MSPSLPRLIFLACAAVALLAGCGSSPSANLAASATTGELGPPQVDRAQGTQRAEYRLSSDDIIDVAVYQVPDLNRSVQLDGNGRIVLPLVGMMQASGKTIRELEADLTKRLGDRFLQKPQVAVFLKESIGQRIVVEGDVKTPGLVQARGAVTLMSVIASTGGFAETADLSAVFVLRRTDKGRMAARFDAGQIRAGAAEDPQVYGGDTIIVDNSSGKMAWKYFRDALPVASFFKFLL